MGFGSEILLASVFGFLLLGPKRLPVILGHIARAKTQFDKAARGFQSQFEAHLESQPHDRKVDILQKATGSE